MKYWMPILLLVMLAGCSTAQMQQVDAATGTVVVLAEKINDDHLRLSHRSLCSASMSSMQRLYGNNPRMVANILASCGWSPEMVRMITGMYVEESDRWKRRDTGLGM